MTLTQLEYILAVERFRSFSRAAESVHVTQPSLSAQVAKLEDELGLQIFDRGRTPISPTEPGRALLAQARIIVDESKRFSEIAAQWSGDARGEFRLGLIPTIAPFLLPYFLKPFTQKHPSVQLTIVEDTTHNLIHRITTGELDAAIVSTPRAAPEGLMERPLYYEPFAVYAGPRNPLLTKKLIRQEDLRGNDILLLDETHCMRDQVEAICRLRAERDSTPGPRMESGSLPTLLLLVETQSAYTLVPQLATLRMPAQQVNRYVRPFAAPVPHRKISLVFHKAHLKRALIDALTEEVSSHLPDAVRPASIKASVKVVDPGKDHFKD